MWHTHRDMCDGTIGTKNVRGQRYGDDSLRGSFPRRSPTVDLTDFEPETGTSVYWDRGSPGEPARRCSDAARAESLWQASLEQLRDKLPDARAPQLVTNYAGTFQAFGPARRNSGRGL